MFTFKTIHFIIAKWMYLKSSHKNYLQPQKIIFFAKTSYFYIIRDRKFKLFDCEVKLDPGMNFF